MQSSVLIRNVVATAVSFVGATIWTKLLARLVNKDRVAPRAARKLIHISTAPLFACTWPLYSFHPYAAFFAASVPLTFALRIAVNPGADAIVRAVARSTPSESDDAPGTQESADSKYAREGFGPLVYGLVVAALTAFSWRSQPSTYIALAAMCFGDGMADLIGTACNAGPILPRSIFRKKKTIPGSIACLFSVFSLSWLWLRIPFVAAFVKPAVLSTGSVAVVAAAATLAELLPVEDNFTVPFSAFVVSRLLQS